MAVKNILFIAVASFFSISHTAEYNSPLHELDSVRSLANLTKVITQGHNINAKNARGQTPLMLALFHAYDNAPKIIECLITHGADPRATDNNGNTAWHWFTLNQYVVDTFTFKAKGKVPYPEKFVEWVLSIARCLVEHRVPFDIANTYGEYPLHKAARYGMPELVAFFLQQGQSVNLCDNEGWSVLHTAIQGPCNGERNHDAAAVVRILIEHGADVNQPAIFHKTFGHPRDRNPMINPLERALFGHASLSEKNQATIEKYLLQANATCTHPLAIDQILVYEKIMPDKHVALEYALACQIVHGSSNIEDLLCKTADKGSLERKTIIHNRIAAGKQGAEGMLLTVREDIQKLMAVRSRYIQSKEQAADGHV